MTRATVITALGTAANFQAAWAAFRDDHASLLEHLQPDAPLYPLPATVVAALATNNGRWTGISAEAVAAETALRALCARFHSAGWWRDRPVHCHYLVRSFPALTEGARERLGWSQTNIRQFEVAARNADVMAHRIKAYAGWLSCEPDFLAATDQLRGQWHAMPAAERPDSLSPQTSPAAAAPNSNVASAMQGDFQQQLVSLCERWELTGLASWDLPLPQGPHIVQHLPANSPALRRRSVTVSIPFFYPLQADDRLLDDILHEQQRQADERGIDSSAAGLRHADAYAQILDVVHLERIVRSRYPAPSGFVPCLLQGIAATIDRSINQVDKYRKAISACRRGNRQRVSWLNPRS
jgi:hypothetical protein